MENESGKASEHGATNSHPEGRAEKFSSNETVCELVAANGALPTTNARIVRR